MKATLQRIEQGARQRAFTLIEMLVAVAVLAMIITALMAILNQVTKAMHLANAQTDVQENGRSITEMISREMQQAVLFQPGGTTNLGFGFSNVNFVIGQNLNLTNYLVNHLALDSLPWANELQYCLFATRRGTTNTFIGYYVGQAGNGVGTLYRFTSSHVNYSTNITHSVVNYTKFWSEFQSATNAVDLGNLGTTYMGAVAEGIVHLRFTAYTNTGDLFIPGTNYLKYEIPSSQDYFTFYTNKLPAFVEVELGILEPSVLAQLRAMPDGAQYSFLTNTLRTAKVHFYKERIPVIAAR